MGDARTTVGRVTGRVRRTVPPLLRASASRLGAVAARLDPPPRRSGVGGLWDEMGRHQFDYLVAQGLQPAHRMLDVGCGSLRGGLHFVGYLEPGHYTGVDRDGALLRNGRAELRDAGLQDRRPTLVCNGDFDLDGLGPFDVALAQSVFSHLDATRVMRCLAAVAGVLRPGGTFYATFFPSPGPRLRRTSMTVPIVDGGTLTVHPDADPYFYDPDLFRWMVEGSELSCDYRGDWGHPRGQHMLAFTRTG